MTKHLKLLISAATAMSLMACGAEAPHTSGASQARTSAAPSPAYVVPEVAYCDMAHAPERYTDQLIRTEAVLSVGRETTLMYAPDCSSGKSVLTFRSDGLEVEKTLGEAFEAHRGGKPIVRVIAILIGRLEGPSGEGFGHLNHFRYQFDIVSVEKFSAAPPDIVAPS